MYKLKVFWKLATTGLVRSWREARLAEPPTSKKPIRYFTSFTYEVPGPVVDKIRRLGQDIEVCDLQYDGVVLPYKGFTLSRSIGL